MGQIERISSSLLGKLSSQLSRLLDAGEREAVLGDLAEDGARPLIAMSSIAGLAFRRVVLRRKGSAVLVSATGTHCALDEEEAKPWQEWVIPLAFGLIASVCVVALLVPSPRQTFSWTGLFSRSAWLLLGAALAAITTVFIVHRSFREYLGRPGSTLLACAWSTAIWIPLLLLMWTQRALWVVLTPVPIAAILASFTKRQRVAYRDGSGPIEPMTIVSRKGLFEGTSQLWKERLSVMPLVCALLLDSALIAAAFSQLSLASSLVILTTACLAWGFTPDRVAVTGGVSSRSRVSVVPCFLLTCLALTPFLRAGLDGTNLSGVVLARPLVRIPRVVEPGIAYSSVVLMAPPLPKHKLITSPPKALIGGLVRPAKRLTIPFDGAYWYFQDPETQPKLGGRVKRGDPLKDHVHSGADWTPLKMEAHQRLGVRLEADCCRSMAVALVNADNRPGLIAVEAKLRNISQSGTSSVSLGTVPLRSSTGEHIALDRPRVNETLRFPLHGKASTFQFNEISLVFKLAQERNLAGARVQVVNFTLEP